MGNLTPETLVAGIGVAMAFGAVFWKGINWILDRFSKADDRDDELLKELADFRLHVASTYVQKEDLAKTMEPITDSMAGIRHVLDTLTQRIDRVIENQARPVSRRAGSQQ